MDQWRTVAVIGAGPSGLITARELLHDGHDVVIFEQGKRIGGTWVYDPRESGLDLNAGQHEAHSSIYKSLRTNLPRELMGFLDYPFEARSSSKDARRFPGHEEVLSYLESFAAEFGLHKLVRLNTKVTYVGLNRSVGAATWIVETAGGFEKKGTREVFEAVVICTGHYTRPRVAKIPGIENWPGKQCHSHTYRTPEPFKDQVVAVIGNGPSGQDLSRDIASTCKKVHWCAKSWDSSVDFSKPLQQGKIQRHLMIDSAENDGRVLFADGTSALVDVIFHCTGYLYDFPFLDTDNYVTVKDNCVGPLFKHVFPPALAPSLSFVGLPCKVFPFPLSQLQAKWISAVLMGQAPLPSPSEMTNDVHSFYKDLEARGVPMRFAHCFDMEMFDYADWLAKQRGGRNRSLGSWRKELFLKTRELRKLNPADYRDLNY